MYIIKKIFSSITGYWLHKLSTLPVGANLYLDIHKKINYGSIDTMFDVGANSGQTWAWFRHHEKYGKIYCFEPVSETFEALQTTTKKDNNCIVEKIALGETRGEKKIKLFDSDLSVLNSLNNNLMNENINARQETIRIDTLDNYCDTNGIKKIDLLKIDTEGYELNVLNGAHRMLDTASISMIYCEVGVLKKNKRNTNFSVLTEWLAEKDYYFFGMYQLALNSWKSGDYYGNALFVYKKVFNP